MVSAYSLVLNVLPNYKITDLNIGYTWVGGDINKKNFLMLRIRCIMSRMVFKKQETLVREMHVAGLCHVLQMLIW